MDNGIFRKRKTTFAQVSNDALRNPELSLKAKGLYSLIQSYITLDDFVLYKNYLMSLCKEGERAFGSTWQELKDAGYLKQYRIPTKESGFIYEYELLDIADKSTPSLTNLTINREVSSTNKKDENIAQDHNLQNVPYAECTQCNSYPVQNVGDINNTNINNTNNTDNNISSSSNIDTVSNVSNVDNLNITEEEDSFLNTCKKKLDSASLWISKENLEELVNVYNPIDTLRAIQKAIAVHKSGKTINRAYNYLLAVLSDMNQAKITNINIEAKKSTFNDYEQRNYDFAQLERQLLGWNDEN